MSLLSKLGRSIKKRIVPAVTGFLTGGPIGAAAAIGGTLIKSRPQQAPLSMAELGPPMQASMMGALPALGRAVLPALGRVLPGAGRAVATVGRAVGRVAGNKWSRRAVAAAGYFQIGQLVYDTAGNLVGQVGRRRMNPLNHRALRRAISRVKSAKKICRQVEKISGGPRRRQPAFASKKCH